MNSGSTHHQWPDRRTRTARRPAPARSKPVLGALSVLLALWFGLTAPSVSPVVGRAPATAPPAAPALSEQPGDAGLDLGAAGVPFVPGRGHERGRR